ncbi:MAG: TonB family protein [Acidobacteriota bacterium]|nr:TonB family protein [Acidobacteriota bacterium]
MRTLLFLIYISTVPLQAGKNALFNAIEAGDIAAVTQHLEQGGKADVKAKRKITAAMAAAKTGHLDILNLLADNGADLDARDYYGETALVKAISYGRMGVVASLLDRGVDVTIPSKQGSTPLMFAAAKNERFMIRMLHAKGADLEAEDNYGMTPVFYAVINGQVQALSTLMELGARADVKNKRGATPMDYAQLFVHKDTALLLSGKGYLAAPTHPLFNAVYKNDPQRIRELLQEGANADHAGKNGETALLVAGRLGLHDVASQLLAGGAEMNKADKEGETPLYQAVAGGRVEVAKLLLEAGADLDASCNDGITALGLAVYEEDETLFRMLREAGAGVLYRTRGKAVMLPEKADTIAAVRKKVGKIPWRLSRCEENTYSINDKRVSPPVFTSRVTPRYPRDAVSNRLSGSVVLEAVLGKDGVVRNIRVLKDLGGWQLGFEANAILALRQWEFEPGKIEEKPVDVRMALKIDFVLR